MVGRIIIARVNPPDIMDQPNPRNITKNTNPNNPKIIEGTPDKVSAVRFTTQANLLFALEYSSRYTAAATPRGTAKSKATAVRYKVLTMVVDIPPSFPAREGGCIIKSRLMPGNPRTAI
jgi:hypothetical protein